MDACSIVAEDKQCHILTADGEMVTGPVVVYRYPVTGFTDVEASCLDFAPSYMLRLSHLHSFFFF